MNKRELVEQVGREMVTTKAAAEDIVNTVLQAIQRGLREDGEVSLPGFGSWTVRQRPARRCRHPQTGEPMRIPAGPTISFRAAKGWKDGLRPDAGGSAD